VTPPRLREPGASAGRPLYGIDAGGTTTIVRTSEGIGWDAPSVNPSSVGEDEAARSLADVFARIRADTDSTRPAVWLASASLDSAKPANEVLRLAASARSVGLHGELIVSNDVTPLVLDAPPDAGHVVAVCGTGSGFLASDGTSAPRRIGGCEYLGSDEGSAFDIGLNGLRAAVRGLDGRGDQTTLADLLADETGAPAPDLARTIARAPFPKAAVASLAPIVLRAWQSGDAVAASVIGNAIGELTVGVRAARDAAELAPGWCASATGGVMAASREFFDEFAAATTRLGATSVRLITDPATSILATLTRFASADPTTDMIRVADRRISCHAWHVDLDDPGAVVR
jgi:N-acetylglucosamine kinase-like BadF-type ATPase